MTKEKKNVSKDIEYNKAYNKKRKAILRVEATTADNDEAVAEMDQMKIDLIAHSGSAKKGVIDLYRFAKEKDFFNK